MVRHRRLGRYHLIGGKCTQCATYVFPPRQLDIGATSDGAAALLVASADFTRKHLGSLDGVPSVRAISTVTPRYPQHLPELPDIATGR